MSANVVDVERALAGLRMGYQSDGYDLVVDEVTQGVAKLRITAGPDACVECLVPKPIAVQMIQTTLEDVPGLSEIQVEYPLQEPHQG